MKASRSPLEATCVISTCAIANISAAERNRASQVIPQSGFSKGKPNFDKPVSSLFGPDSRSDRLHSLPTQTLFQKRDPKAERSPRSRRDRPGSGAACDIFLAKAKRRVSSENDESHSVACRRKDNRRAGLRTRLGRSDQRGARKVRRKRWRAVRSRFA